MAETNMVELVIRIPEEMAYRFKHEGEQKHYDYHTVIKACTNGTLLPKGHGRLKDIDKFPVNEIERAENNYECGENEYHSEEIVYLDDIISAETIIEADTQNKEKEEIEEDREI